MTASSCHNVLLPDGRSIPLDDVLPYLTADAAVLIAPHDAETRVYVPQQMLAGGTLHLPDDIGVARSPSRTRSLCRSRLRSRARSHSRSPSGLLRAMPSIFTIAIGVLSILVLGGQVDKFLAPPDISWEVVLNEPLYRAGTLLNETLRRSRNAAAAALGFRSDNPFRSYKFSGNSPFVLDGIDDLEYATIAMWGSDHYNSTVFGHLDQLRSTRFSMLKSHNLLTDFDAALSSVLRASSNKINRTLDDITYGISLPSSSFRPQSTSGGSIFKWRLWAGLGLADTIPVDGDLKKRYLWESVCDCYSRLDELADRLLGSVRAAEDSLVSPTGMLRSTTGFLRIELDQRRANEAKHVKSLITRFDLDLQQWNQYVVNRWRNSTAFFLTTLGWFLNGQEPPILDRMRLEEYTRTQKMLDRTIGQLYSTVTHLEFIGAEIATVKHEMDNRRNAADDDAVRNNHLECSPSLEVPHGANPVDPVLFFRHIWSDLQTKMTHFDRELFGQIMERAQREGIQDPIKASATRLAYQQKQVPVLKPT